MKMMLAVLASIPLAVALQPAARAPSRRAILHAAGLSLVAPTLPAQAEMMYSASECTATAICSGNGKVALAAYDQMLLKRTDDEL